MSTEFEDGVLVGLLVGEGHFGGDGRQPQITLRMHERHEAIFRWLERAYPGGRLYGPYSHGGRRYFQWMVRGAYLRDVVAPLVARRLSPDLDDYAHTRFVTMCTEYARQLSPSTPSASSSKGGLESAPPEHPEITAPRAASTQRTSAGENTSDTSGSSNTSSPADTSGVSGTGLDARARAEHIFRAMREHDAGSDEGVHAT